MIGVRHNLDFGEFFQLHKSSQSYSTSSGKKNLVTCPEFSIIYVTNVINEETQLEGMMED